jgi:canavanine-gamma-lyase
MMMRVDKEPTNLTKPNSSLDTIALHPFGGHLEPGDPLTADLTLSTSFKMAPDAGFTAASQGDDPLPIYARWGNPTVHRLERHLCALERAEDAVCFGSGMAAVSALFFSTLSSGDHLVASNICYAGVAELMHDLQAHRGIKVSFVDTSDIGAVADAMTPRTKMVFVETPANPILRLTDIRAVAERAASVGARLAVDSTFATPIATRPLDLGADFVVHSLTKYACGHGDALGGAVLGSRENLEPLRSSALVHNGAVLHPLAAWLIGRSLQTLPLRMRQHQDNAFAVARFLEQHPAVEQVFYPGLSSHPQHELAKSQMANFSGMIAFRARNSKSLRDRFAAEAEILSYAVSLGKTKSLIVLVDTDEVQSQSFQMPPAELEKYRAAAGDGIFRLSVGLEDSADIIADLDRILGS